MQKKPFHDDFDQDSETGFQRQPLSLQSVTAGSNGILTSLSKLSLYTKSSDFV